MCACALEPSGLQFPELGSTAFECPDFGHLAFDTLRLDVEALRPSGPESRFIGPDREAYRERLAATEYRKLPLDVLRRQVQFVQSW